MSQAWDVELDGVGYALVARDGAWRRTVAPRVGPTAAGRFDQGGWRRRRMLGAGDGAVAWSLGFLPRDGSLLEIAPAGTVYSAVGGSATVYGGWAELAGVSYLAAGDGFYEVTLSSGNFASLTSRGSPTAAIKGLARHKDKVHAALGTAKRATWDGSTWSETAETADAIASYAGLLWRAAGSTLYASLDDGTSWRTVPLHDAGTINALAVEAAALWVGAGHGLYRVTAALRAGNPGTAPGTLDVVEFDVYPVEVGWAASASNAAALVAYGGAVYWSRAGAVWRWRGGTVERVPDLYGTCRGMAVAGEWLVVALHDAENGYWLWLGDGEGWWGLAQGSSGDAKHAWPALVAGCSDADLIAWSDGTRHLTRWRAERRDAVFLTGQAAPVVCLPALVAGAGDEAVRWLRVGLSLESPYVTVLTASPATWAIDYQIEGDTAWTQAGVITPDAGAVDVGFELVDVVARRLWLAVRCSGGGANNPALRSVWAAWSSAGPVGQRQRWELQLRASDQAVGWRGQGDERSGAEIAAALGDLVGAGAVAFADRDGAAYSVVVLEVEERGGGERVPRVGETTARVVVEEV